MKLFRKLAVYSALVALAGCSAPQKDVAFDKPPSDYELSTPSPVVKEWPYLFRFRSKGGDNPWDLAQIAYGSGTENKRLMEDNGITDPKKLMPDEWIKVYMTYQQAGEFKNRHPDRDLSIIHSFSANQPFSF